MGIPDNIKRLRATHGLTQSELGKIAGVSDKAIWTWENGTAEPRMGAIQKIADHFNIKKSDLIEDHTEQPPTTKPRAIKIPVLGMVHAGYPVDAIEDVLDWEEVTPEMSARGDLMALQVKGDCMEPRFAEGDVVIVLCQNTAESGDIVIVMVNHDEAEMKKLKRFENGCINLVPLNAAYPVKSFSPQEIEELPIRILGKVIELRAKF
jgi:repressor LexA